MATKKAIPPATSKTTEKPKTIEQQAKEFFAREKQAYDERMAAAAITEVEPVETEDKSSEETTDDTQNQTDENNQGESQS